MDLLFVEQTKANEVGGDVKLGRRSARTIILCQCEQFGKKKKEEKVAVRTIVDVIRGTGKQGWLVCVEGSAVV